MTHALPLDDLRTLLPDWRRHLRVVHRAPTTITSYLRVADAFVDYLVASGMPTAAGAVTREHVERYLEAMFERGSSAANVAKHHRSLQRWRAARSTTRRWSG